jgi:YVTN family beta-propeller protein
LTDCELTEKILILKKINKQILLTSLAVVSFTFLFSLPAFAVSMNSSSKFTAQVFVSNYNTDYVSVLKGITVVDPVIYVGNNPTGFAYDAANNRIYVGSWSQGTVSIIDASDDDVLGVITSLTTPNAIAYAPNTGMIYVIEYNSNDLAIINPQTNIVTSRMPMSCGNRIIYNPITEELYVSNGCGTTVSAVVPSTGNVTTIGVGSDPVDLAFDSANNNTYVANYNSNTISVINDKNNVISTLTGFRNPDGVAFNSANNDIYVTNEGNGTVSILSSSNALVGTALSVGSCPSSATFNPATSEIYVANSCSNSISILKGTKVLTTVTSTFFNNPNRVGAS